MNHTRTTYLAAAAAAVELLASAEVAAVWQNDSVLESFRVSGLAGHLARTIFGVDDYLLSPAGSGAPITAGAHFAEFGDPSGLDSELNVGVRERGEDAARRGAAQLAKEAADRLGRLSSVMAELPDDRLIEVFGGRVMLLDEYLKTRLVEIIVHVEDLSLSAETGVPLPVDAIEIATDVVVAAGRARHGDLAFLRGDDEKRARRHRRHAGDLVEPTVVYTDGACSGNPGPGGWAWVVPDGPEASGGDDHTTNQRMELEAVLDAVRSLEGPLQIVSDSTYVVNCFRDGWWEGWVARGWVNSQRKPVANRDLWEPLIDLFQERNLTFQWVKGHSGDRWNDRADELAVAAAQFRRGQAQAVTSSDSDDVEPERPIPGRVLIVTGHRPTALGGYGENLFAASVRDRLAEIIAAKASMHDDLVVISGLNLGAETLGVEAAVEGGVDYEVVLPFPDPDSKWPEESRSRFRQLVAGARSAHTLERKAPDSNQKLGASFRRREGWMRRASDEAIVVWDGKDGAIGKTVRSLQEDLGEENVWIVDPGSTEY